MTLTANWGRESGEARTEAYRVWRTGLALGAVCDVDQIEYDWQTGRPLLVTELCAANYGPLGAAFLAALEAKVSRDRPQGRVLRYLATTFRVPLVLVAFVKDDLEAGVWVKQVDVETPWQAMDLAAYAERLRRFYAKARAA